LFELSDCSRLTEPSDDWKQRDLHEVYQATFVATEVWFSHWQLEDNDDDAHCRQ